MQEPSRSEIGCN